MSDKSDDNSKNTLSLGGKKTLELKKVVSAGRVRQSFSHGRSKTVEVEVKKRRRTQTQPPESPPESIVDKETIVEEQPASPAAPPEQPSAIPHGLTKEEWHARIRAVRASAQKKTVEQNDSTSVAKVTDQPQARKRVEIVHEAAATKSRTSKAKEKEPEKVEQPKAEEKPPLTEDKEEVKASPKPESTPSSHKRPEAPAVVHETGTSKRVEEERRPSSKSRRNEPHRREGKLTLQQALITSETGEDQAQRTRSEAALRRAREKQKQQQDAQAQPAKKLVRDIIIPETITVQELSNRMAVRAVDVIKVLMKMDMMVTINQIIDADTAEIVVSEFGHSSKRVAESDVESALQDIEDTPESLQPRAPVVTVMGHVDHGKTSLLDALRATDIVAKEAGGITQHIGAYQIKMPAGQDVTFIDTPGHAAFTAMRARGAQVTDIVILVVAADDGIKEQTVEAINHIKAAKVPMIIAINKIDKPEADADRVRQELLVHEIVVESLGGDVLDVEVSAKQKKNLDKLEEAILLQSEILELKANPDRPAQGIVIEARMDQGRGSVATVLIQRGTIKIGEIFISGSEWGRVRALVDDRGKNIKFAGPSVPIEVLGLSGVPEAGDDFVVVSDEAQARDISEYRHRQSKAKQLAIKKPSSLEDIFAATAAQEIKKITVVIKGDVQGSVEAIVASLVKLGNEEVAVKILHSGVGAITESDITLAHASGGVVIGFNVRANPQARELATRDHVLIQYYSVIYNVIDDIKASLSGLLSPKIKEHFLGRATIRQVFSVSKVGKIAGCIVSEGTVKRGAKVRLLRDDIVIHEGTLKTLKRFKDEVKEVREGSECGMAFTNYQDLRENDVIECFETEEIARTI